jgi:hypothetical protein
VEPVVQVAIDDRSAQILGQQKVWISLYDSASSDQLQACVMDIIDSKCKRNPLLRKFFLKCSVGDKKKGSSKQQ